MINFAFIYCSSMRGDLLLSDVTLFFGDRRIQCHRAILASRSAKFRMMFEECKAAEGNQTLHLKIAEFKWVAIELQVG